jgi:hypothetical protein
MEDGRRKEHVFELPEGWMLVDGRTKEEERDKHNIQVIYDSDRCNLGRHVEGTCVLSYLRDECK